jgi:hypothetical protein
MKRIPLHKSKHNFNFIPSELQGGNTAPLLRLFCFKKNTTTQDSAHREVCGRYLVAQTNLGFIFCLKYKELVMPISQEELSNLRLVETSPIDELIDKVAIMQLAVQGMFSVMSEHEGPRGLFCAGLMAAYNDLEIALEIYMKTKGDKIW